MKSLRGHLGFSIIEMMIALAAGLVVIGAVLLFTMSSLRSNSEYVRSTTLQQELRNTLDQITRDLRRAGYDEAYLTYLLKPTGAAPSPFAPIFVNGTFVNDTTNNTRTASAASCILYAYDRGGTGPGVVNLAGGEIRGLRRATATVNGNLVGIVELAESAAGVTPACGGTAVDYTAYPTACSSGGWCALSDPRRINITRLSITMTNSPTALSAASSVQIRTIVIELSGTLVGDTSVVRTVQATVKVRADCLRSSNAACEAAPTGT